LDNGGSVVNPPAPVPRTIEFIGDSITCGYGIQGKPPCDFTSSTENNYLSYSGLVGRHFNTNYYVESWSGRGVVRNYGDPNITSQVPLPVLYPRSIAGDNSTNWDFPTKSRPDAVVINLGTNDYSTLPHPPQTIFETGYQNFIAFLLGNYQQVHIFLVCGPLINNPCCSYIQDVVKTKSINFPTIYYVDMTNILNSTDYGCDGHPNVSGHQKMANVAIPTIKKVMGW